MARPKKTADEQPQDDTRELSPAEKAKILKEKFNKQFKKNILQTYVDEDDISVKRLPGGILSLDLILGGGNGVFGLPVGRVIEVYGPESAGKSSVTTAWMANAQAQGKTVALIDAEHALDPEYAAKTFGLKLDELLVCQPETGEEAYDVALSLADSGQVDLIVLDSVAAILPKAEDEGSMDQQFMGLAARLNNKMMRKIVPALGHNNCTLILINQIREKMVMMGNPETTTGGRGIKYASSIRLDVRRSEEVNDNGELVGHIIKCKTIKNKTGKPQRVTHIRLDYNKGFNKEFCLVEQGIMHDIISGGGTAWLKFDGEQFQGRTKLVDRLENDPVLAKKLETAILEKLSDA